MHKVKWTDTLPAPFDSDPMVVVVLAPNDALWKIMESDDETVKLCVMELEHTKDVVGLQVLAPELKTWQEHSDFFDVELNIRMANPVYVGRLSKLPQSTMLHAGMCPLAFVKNKMTVEFLNLKSYFYKGPVNAKAN